MGSAAGGDADHPWRLRGFDVRYGARLATPNGRWLVFSGDPAADVVTGLALRFQTVQRHYGLTPVQTTTRPATKLYLYAWRQFDRIAHRYRRKIYDSTATAAATVANLSFSGQLAGDVVTANVTSSAYISKNVGTGKQVDANVTLSSVVDGAGAWPFTTTNSAGGRVFSGNIGTITPRA